MKNCVFILTIIFLIASLANIGTCTTWPTESWKTSTPEEQGMNSELLTKNLDFLREHREEFHLHSLLVIRHGHCLY